MTGDGPYFGYETSQNEQLMNARRLAAKMGEDIRYYPQPESSGDLPDFTINWENPPFDKDETEKSNAAFNNDTIERIYKRIMAQDAGALRDLADQWWLTYLVLDDIRGRLRTAANGLKYGGDGTSTTGKGWTGKAADAFLARGPGATLKSLDDWKAAALSNRAGARALAGVITRYQAQMDDLWEEYKQGLLAFRDDWMTRNAPSYSSIDELKGTHLADKFVTDLRAESWGWAKKAQKIQYDMAQEYWSVMNEDFGGGRATVYEGPTNAIQHNPEFIARSMAGQFGVPGVTAPNVTTPNIVRPDIAPPQIQAPVDVRPTGTPPAVSPPVVTPPNVVPPAVAPPLAARPVAPPVVPQAPVAPQAPAVGQPSGTPAVRPPAAPGTSGLLGNAKGSGVPGVLRSGAGGAPVDGRPPGLPGSPTKGQPHPPPQIKRPGQQAPPSPPPRRGGDGPSTKVPARPAGPGQSEFGGAPRTPSSPVLRAPRPAPDQPGPRTGTPSPPRPGAAPPVLNRPRPATQPPPPARPAAPPTADRGPLAPPKPATTDPVVGRSARPPAETTQRADSSGVMRGRRARPAGYEAEIGSRRRDGGEHRSTADEEFEKLRKLLAQEEAWTVATPGGGVLDGKPARPAGPTAEPKPTLGGS